MVRTNGRNRTFYKFSDLYILPVKVHFDGSSLATVLSMKDVTNLRDVVVIMDSSKEKAILVIVKGQKTFKFLECGSGLYYIDTEHLDKHVEKFKNNNNVLNHYSALPTLSENKKGYTQGEI